MRTARTFHIGLTFLMIALSISLTKTCFAQPLLKSEKQLTFGKGPDTNPAWSPDGKTIAFHSMRKGNYDVWRVALEDGALKQLTTSSLDEGNPSWSLDSKKLAFVRYLKGSGEGYGNLFLISIIDGFKEIQLTTDGTRKGSASTWTPDGNSIIYSEARGTKETFETDVWSLNITTKQRVRLIEVYKWKSHKKGLFVGSIAINAQGNLLAFDAVGGESEKRWLYVMDLNLKNPKPIVTDLDRPWFPNYSPDGKWIAFHAGKLGADGIWIVKPDGSGKTRLISSGKGDRQASWSPDGRRIAYVKGVHEEAHIWILELQYK